MNARLSLTSSRNACAILNLEEGEALYTYCSDVDSETIGETFREKANEWFSEAVSMRRIPSTFSIEKLILVTGFYKSSNWEAVALSSSSSAGDLSFTIQANKVAGGNTSFHWDSIQHLSPDYSTGHCHPEDRTAGTGVSFARCCHVHSNRNQCIFLRGFRIRSRLLRGTQVEKLPAAGESKPSFREHFKPFFNLNSKTSQPPSDNFSQGSSSAHDSLEPIEGFPDTHFCVSRQLVNESPCDFFCILGPALRSNCSRKVLGALFQLRTNNI